MRRSLRRSTARGRAMRSPALTLRRCSCGKQSEGECEECKKQKLQRAPSAAARDEKHEVAPPVVNAELQSNGQPLADGVRGDMEGRFGFDFGNVRVHTGSRADESAAAVGARAYTVGQHMVFAGNEYAPHKNEGRELIAHELAHVVQQGGEAPSPNAPIELGDVKDPLEHQAESAARDVTHGNGTANLAPQSGAGALARKPVLRREGPGTLDKKEEVPIERVPYGDKQEKAKEGGDEKEQEEPKWSLASASRPTCNPIGMSRAKYLSQPGTSTDDFGLTRFAGTVGMAISTSKVKGGVMLDPLKVTMPPMTSVFTGPGTFTEGEAHVFGQNDSDCKGGKVPIRWEITQSGADKIKEAEQEHCSDMQYAWDVSLGWYASVVDDLIAKKKVFPNETAAFKHLEKRTGTHPTGWLGVFTCLLNKTKARDGKKFTRAWHTPQVKAKPPRIEDNCAFSRIKVSAANFPELGKHPTPDVIKDCGESPEAVKAVAAAAKAAADAKAAEEAKAKEDAAKKPDAKVEPTPTPKVEAQVGRPLIEVLR